MKTVSATIHGSAVVWSLLLAASLALAGCSPGPADTAVTPTTTSPAPAAAPASTNSTRTVFDQDVPTVPNPKLPAIRLFVGAHELQTELALTDLQIRTGMMFRTNILENEAMLFVLATPHQVGFWMKNVPIDLSCAYIDPDGVILETHDMVAGEVKPILSASDRVQFVLETRRGWFERQGVKPGVLIRTEQGTFQETFFQRRLR